MNKLENGSPKRPTRIVRTTRYSVFVARHANFTMKEDDEEKEKNFKYLKMLLFGAIPNRASSLDASRMMICMFCVNSIEMLRGCRTLTPEETWTVIEWIYSRQTVQGGFDGGSDTRTPGIHGHLAMTYSALVALLTLGDDLSRVDKSKFNQWLRTVQDEDGSFRAVAFGSESDTRFIYSAVASCFLLQEWTALNVDRATEFILSCWNVADGGFGLRPGQESHGGATYTCLASLSLLGKLDHLDKSQVQDLIRFCTGRQIAGAGGFNGRANKDCDTCYAYWIGASLQILNRDSFIHRQSLAAFLDTTFNPLIGGFSKSCGEAPDPYHTHFGTCARVLCEPDSREHIEASLGLSMKAYKRHFKEKPARTASGTLVNITH